MRVDVVHAVAVPARARTGQDGARRAFDLGIASFRELRDFKRPDRRAVGDGAILGEPE